MPQGSLELIVFTGHFTAILPQISDFSVASVGKQMDCPPQHALDTHVHTHEACEARQNKA